MKSKRKNHKEAIVFYSALILEIIVSSYFAKIDSFFFLTRAGIFLVSITAIEIGSLHVLKWIGLVIVILSMSGIRDKWQSLEKEKFLINSKLEETKIREPEKPALSDCFILAKWARVDCTKENKELQKDYQKNLNSYNRKILNSENKIKNIDTSLNFYDTQPILLYCFLISILTAVSILGAKKPESEKNKKEIGLSNLEKVKLIDSRNEQEKISQGLLCKEYNISLSEFKRIRAKLKPKIEPNSNLRILKKRDIA